MDPSLSSSTNCKVRERDAHGEHFQVEHGEGCDTALPNCIGCGSLAAVLDGSVFDHLTIRRAGRGSSSGVGAAANEARGDAALVDGALAGVVALAVDEHDRWRRC